MAGSPKTVDVEVHIIDDSSKDPPYDFWLGTKDHKVGKPKGDTLTFDNEGLYDGFEIRFDIVDETGQGFLFMEGGKDANGNPDPNLAPMWVKKVNDLHDPCPDHEFWDEFETTKVSPNNKTLYVRNWNKTVQLFKFALMFSRTPRHAPHEIMYDPGGDNQNGHGLSSDLKTATADVLLVAGAGAILTYAATASIDLIDSNVSMGFALLIALTVGFGIAALLFRLMPWR